MSRDPGGADPERDAELVTAYVDGCAELSPDERHRVEARLARDPAAHAEADAVRGLLGQLRALPPEGGEPDWAVMARSIRSAVGDAVPRPWWRRWTWLAPLTAATATAAVLLAIWSSAAPVVPAPSPQVAGDTPSSELATREPPEDVVALWLDGTELEVDLSAAELLGPVAGVDDADAVAVAGSDDSGLLPASNLAWVDDLDDEAIDSVERWLNTPAPADPDMPERAERLERKKG
jgi:hypothetical protein